MELSTNITYLRRQRGVTEERDIIDCARIIKNAGFRFIDFNPTRFLRDDNWKGFMTETSEKLNEMGLTVDQTHAPYNFKDVDSALYSEIMQRSFEASKILGAKNIVIHADKYIPDDTGLDYKKALTQIYDFYAPYVEYAKKVGLGVAIENLFEDGPCGMRTRFTAFVEEQIAMIEKFGDPSVTACWDFGHGKVAYGSKHLDALKQLGSLVTCTHVHDNIWRCDLHQNIFLGDTDWEEVIRYLKEINYQGKFTFEMVYGTIPDPLLQKYMNLFYETGEYLINM